MLIATMVGVVSLASAQPTPAADPDTDLTPFYQQFERAIRSGRPAAYLWRCRTGERALAWRNPPSP